MEQTLSLTKLSPPHCIRILARTRLFTEIDTSLKHPLTWISGPSGAGKTMLVLSYLESKAILPLWFQVDEGDNDLASFFYHLSLLTQSFDPEQAPLPLLTPEYVHGILIFARNFIREFYARLPEKSVLVLDNFQDAGINNPLEPLLPLILEEIPATVRVIILSRSSPPDNLASLLVTGIVQTLNWQHLQFTEQEVDDLIQLRSKDMELSLSKIAVAELHQNTQGWAASLVLMLEQPFDKKQPIFSEGRSKEAVFDYFASLLFQNASEEERSFLLKTAVFQDINVDAAEKLTDNPKCNEILEGMAQRNYFTAKRFGAPAVFQYHPLFRVFLLSQAEHAWESRKLAKIRTQAADILLNQHNISHAADLLRQAQDWEKLLVVILNNAQAMIEKGQFSTLRAWIASLPEDLQTQNNWLNYWQGMIEIMIDPIPAIGYFQRAYQISQTENDSLAQVLSWCGAINAYAFSWGEVKTLDIWISDLESILAIAQQIADTTLQEQVDYAIYLALMYRQPEHKKMPEYEAKVWELVLYGKNIQTRVQASSQLLFYLTWWRGDFEKAEILVQTMQPLMDQDQAPPLVKITWHSMLSSYYGTTFRAELCQENINRGIELSDDTGIYIWKPWLYLKGCFLHLQKGGTKESAYYIEQLHNAIRPEDLLNQAIYYHFSAWYALHQSNTDAVKENVLIAQKIAREAGNSIVEIIVETGYTKYLFLNGEPDNARKLAHSIRQKALNINAKTMVFLSYIAEASYFLSKNDQDACIKILHELFSTTKTYSAIWWLDQDFSKFCGLALQNNIEQDYVKEIISRHTLLPIAGYETELWPYPIKIYTLGGFRLVINDEPMEFSSKAPKKPLELLKALIAFGNQNVADAQITEALWPDAEGDAAYDNLRTTVKRLRSLLNEKQAITFFDGKLSLNPAYCWVDACCFERMSQPKDNSKEQLEKALGLYTGYFMASENEHWMLSMRDRIHRQFVRVTCLQAEKYEDLKQWQMVIDVYLRSLNVDELTEVFYHGLMRSYHQIGKTDQVEKIYQQLHLLLDTKLSLTPSSETQKLYNKLINTVPD
jgi:DNA-binding SARP family transcriptional activator